MPDPVIDTTFVAEIVKLGALAVLFGLSMWLVFRIGRDVLAHMAAVEKDRIKVEQQLAEALLEHAKDSERQAEMRRDMGEQGILLQRLLQLVERHGVENG